MRLNRRCATCCVAEQRYCGVPLGVGVRLRKTAPIEVMVEPLQ